VGQYKIRTVDGRLNFTLKLAVEHTSRAEYLPATRPLNLIQANAASEKCGSLGERTEIESLNTSWMSANIYIRAKDSVGEILPLLERRQM